MSFRSSTYIIIQDPMKRTRISDGDRQLTERRLHLSQVRLDDLYLVLLKLLDYSPHPDNRDLAAHMIHSQHASPGRGA
jgi:hypothetical protein